MPLNERAATALDELGTPKRDVIVSLSNELVHILSEQMYRSPLKAIEELVVNAYDAEATQCVLRVPLPPSDEPHVLVFDDGFGMNEEGLENLWHIGRSNKRELELAKRLKRKQIGKFGIGKLATYSIANTVTYLSKTESGLRGVTLDFREFVHDPTGGRPIELKVKELTFDQFEGDSRFKALIEQLGIEPSSLNEMDSWTLVVLEDLKTKMGRIRKRDLNWVLSTAMPLGADFALSLNGERVESRKASYDEVVRFKIAELPAARLEALEEAVGGQWRIENGALYSETFPNGIAGDVLVTERSLYTGKSTDLARSHGFFVRVRGRLVDEADPLFGVEPLSYEVFNRFRADLTADDLDAVVTAPREGFEASDEVTEFRRLLLTLFYEARGRYQEYKRAQQDADKRKREHQRKVIQPDLVERPLADVLSTEGEEEGSTGADADNSWFYIRLGDEPNIAKIVEGLYDPERKRYKYVEIENGRSGRIVEFDPAEATFFVNIDHPVVQAHSDPSMSPLLEDMLTAEVLLEVYLREQNIASSAIGEILERRDLLLRGLASDRIFSLGAIAADLRGSTDDQYDLEVNLVIAARALGFVAKHVGGSGKPDGVARFTDYPAGERKIVLEAKSSEEVPSLGAIDFAGLSQHMIDENAIGCLLVAPSYPGSSREDSQAAKRAESLKISCWTVDQLAAVVESAEARHLSAADVLGIVTNEFTPDEVTTAVSELLSGPERLHRELYGAIIDALRDLHGRLTDRPRTVDQIAGVVTQHEDLRETDYRMIRQAIHSLAGASQGLLRVVGGEKLVLRGDYDELERRVAQLTGRVAPARRAGTFRDGA